MSLATSFKESHGQPGRLNKSVLESALCAINIAFQCTSVIDVLRRLFKKFWFWFWFCSVHLVLHRPNAAVVSFIFYTCAYMVLYCLISVNVLFAKAVIVNKTLFLITCLIKKGGVYYFIFLSVANEPPSAEMYVWNLTWSTPHFYRQGTFCRNVPTSVFFVRAYILYVMHLGFQLNSLWLIEVHCVFIRYVRLLAIILCKLSLSLWVCSSGLLILQIFPILVSSIVWQSALSVPLAGPSRSWNPLWSA